MCHFLIDALGYVTLKSAKYIRRLMYTLYWDVRIRVAATEKDRDSIKRAVILAWRAIRSDEPAAESELHHIDADYEQHTRV